MTENNDRNLIMIKICIFILSQFSPEEKPAVESVSGECQNVLNI